LRRVAAIAAAVVLGGLVLAGFTELVYPTLTPLYGGGEGVHGNMTLMLHLKHETRVRVYFSEPVAILVNGRPAGLGSVELRLQPGSYSLSFIGYPTSKGWVELRQKPPSWLRAAYLAAVLAGALAWRWGS